ncbi:Smr/MutS family protein [Desulfonatronovibrio magnus]|uniref:Smr/MutS family protein n=1 Tax=Desulfonatronovibrio magnus TaxID=698827 RepID=UPI0005EB9157|nr:Smr/MutS family protein [Desulfonatronovibrio magnus]
MKSLKDLKKVKIAPKKDPQPEFTKEEQNKQVQKSASLPETTDDERLFLRAMNGVKPISSKGRQITPRHKKKEIRQISEDQESLNMLNRLVNGDVEFDVEHSDEYIQGYVQGINDRLFRKFKMGNISVQAHLDLHGLNTDQARLSLLNFMREQYINNKKCVLIIPGRGKNSPLGAAVLRNEVQNWLTREPLKRVVLAFCTAQPKHGGAGALYVLIRNFKKTGSKIFWEKFLLDSDH